MPSITIWNRVEPRARSQDMKSGLEARVHDPLWLLTRQWQVGEFAGRDAGSPVMVEVKSTATKFDRYTTGAEPARPYDGKAPLEVLVEREAVRPRQAIDDLRQAAEAGLQFFRMLDAANLASATLARLRAAYLRQYALAVTADAVSQPISAIVAGRVIDGIKLHADLAAAGSALPAQPALSNADRQTVLPIAQAWRAWYESLFNEPAGADSWSPDRMEYSFRLGSASGSTQCVAREYDGGAADWYTFDRSPATPAGGSTQPVATTRRAMPAPVTFRGMPARRFWEMEDAAVDIGALSAAAEDIGRLLLREFALIYGNDWFQIPLSMPLRASGRARLPQEQHEPLAGPIPSRFRQRVFRLDFPLRQANPTTPDIGERWLPSWLRQARLSTFGVQRCRSLDRSRGIFHCGTSRV
jgi:hypothetical protein